jgi:PPOX class probable F420-dependent enzyme
LRELDERFRELLTGRRIAALATTSPDGSPHLAAVWFLFEGDRLYVATPRRSRKARNVAERRQAALMIDVRVPGRERGLTAIGDAELLAGASSEQWNHAIHGRYLHAAALADPRVGPGFAAADDATICLRPRRWLTWDMAALDRQVFGGRISSQGYLLPLEDYGQRDRLV